MQVEDKRFIALTFIIVRRVLCSVTFFLYITYLICLICFCFQEKSTFLLVLDAKTFTELGRAEVPVNIPYGTHGVFNEMG